MANVFRDKPLEGTAAFITGRSNGIGQTVKRTRGHADEFDIDLLGTFNTLRTSFESREKDIGDVPRHSRSTYTRDCGQSLTRSNDLTGLFPEDSARRFPAT